VTQNLPLKSLVSYGGALKLVGEPQTDGSGATDYLPVDELVGIFKQISPNIGDVFAV
jgi:hypothetical protein